MLSSKFSASASSLSMFIMITAMMHKKNLHKSLDLLTSKMRLLPTLSFLKKQDKWLLNEPNREMIRVHRKLRSQSYKPEKNNTPIPLEYLEDTRATKFEYEDGTSQRKVDSWRGKDAPRVVRQEKPLKGTTIFKVKPGGFKRRTNVRASISVGNRRCGVDQEIYVPDSVRESSPSSRKPPSGGSSNNEVPGKKPLNGGSFNDEEPGSSQRQEQKKREDNPVAKEDTSLEPRRVELPLPGQELSAASPSFQRTLKRLENEVELYELHVKHFVEGLACLVCRSLCTKSMTR